jgi:hypothetical protein
MLIANPIYDVVFKYMMEDGKTAKLIISSIIEEEIEELTFTAREFSAELDDLPAQSKVRSSKTVYRLDFAAKIRTSEGLKQVLIEIQKAKFATDIVRFRRYLGEQYANKDNIQVIQINNSKRKSGIPIIGIYFLGHRLMSNIKSSVIGVKRTYYDLITKDEIRVKEPFIESLSHDSYVIQIPELAQKRRNDLEVLLSIFDQSCAVDDVHHILNVREEQFPEKYAQIIRKLQAAIQDAEIKKKMTLEDDLLDELEDLDREIEDLTNQNEMMSGLLRVKEKELPEAEEEKRKAEEENEFLKRRLEELEKLLKGKSEN